MTLKQLTTIKNAFVQELTDTQNGQKSSLSFLINYVPTPFVKDHEVFQVLVIGGTICRNVLMKRHGKQFTILSHTEKEQPIFHTKEALLTFLRLEIDKDVRHIGLNFAFPLEPIVRDGKLDGMFLYGTKDHTFKGLVGKKVGEELEQHMLQNEKRSIQVCVANDTICLLLSGYREYPTQSLIGAIVGTGVNIAFFTSEHEAVTLESGGFQAIPQNAIDKQLDKASSAPKTRAFEKQVSGAHLHQYFNLLLKKKGISYPEIPSTQSLTDLAKENNNIVGKYAREVLARSAQLAACQLAGMLEYRQTHLTGIMEGSLFWKGYEYKETIEKTVKLLSPKYKMTFVQIENSSVLGAAKLIA